MALDREAIRARLADECLSPGPWSPYFTTHGDPYVAQSGRPAFGMVVSTSPDDYGRADCRFIASARDDVPALLDALDAAEERLDRADRLIAILVNEFVGADMNALAALIDNYWSPSLAEA